ncbi:MAG: biotin--[acetyl-CoA-carboxylase] ligase [Anaerovoracaceae bacterium]
MSTKDSVLNALENSQDSFLSGEELSKKLGISRTAVWKAINALRQEGYAVEAVTNRGYLLLREQWRITEDSFKACLPAEYKNIKIHIYDTLDSTNIKAKQIAAENGEDRAVIMARQQTGGRGRLGRSFFSPKEGLYMSILIKPDFDLSNSGLVTSAAAVSVAQSIEEIAHKDAGIKWVNDVYVDGKKVCGILTEGITDFETGRIEHLIIGIGINTTVKDFPKELLQTVGAVEGEYSKSALAASVVSKTIDFIKQIDDPSFIKTYKEKSIVIGKNIKVYKGQYKVNPDDEIPGINARVLDIDSDGGLIVLYSDGTREKLISGEISIRL